MFTLIRNAEVFAPEPLGLCNLLIFDEKIAWIGDRAPTLPADMLETDIDLQGARLVPGLVDLHAHLTGGGGEAGAASRVPPPALSSYTRAGVTTVVGLLGTDDVTRDTAGLLAQARGLNEEGLSAFCWTGGYHLPATTLTGSVRKDIVNIDLIIGAGEIAISDHRSSQPTLDEILRLASECHVAGMMTGKAGILHLHLGDGQRGLDMIRHALEQSELPPRVFHPTHVNRRSALLDEAIALSNSGCHIDITAYDVSADDDAVDAATALRKALDGGVPIEQISVSSDGGGCLPVFDEHGLVERMDVGSPTKLLETLGDLLDAGLALETVLPAFTSSPANLLHLPHKGHVRVDGDADLVVLNDQHEITDCMARGAWHLRNGKSVITGMFE